MYYATVVYTMSKSTLIASNSLGFAVRNLRRDWRRGELLVLMAALAIAVAASTAVSLFNDRVRQAMTASGGEAIAADLRLELRAPLDPDRRARMSEFGLQIASTTTFASVAQANAKTSLVSVKAVDADYPLRGELRIETAQDETQQIGHGPPPGEVWVERRVLADLGIELGDTLQLGVSTLKASALIVLEPDRGTGFIGLAPRVMLNASNLAATELLQPGSRATYRVLLAGEPEKVSEFRTAFEPTLGLGESLENAAEARPALRAALDRADVFLDLAALVAVILAAVAIAMCAHQHALNRYDEIALIKTLGARSGFLTRALLWMLLLLGLIGTLLGAVLGFIAQLILSNLIDGVMGLALPAPSLWAALPAVATGVVVLFGFAWPALAQARHAPAARVFQRALPLPPWRGRLVSAAALVSVAGLVVWLSGDLALATRVLGGGLVAAALLWLAARLGIVLLGYLRRGTQASRHRGLGLGMQAIVRRPRESALLVVGFGVGLSVLFLLVLVRGDLLSGWQQNLADDAPNRFIINISPEQTDAVTQYLQENGWSAPEIFPMVRARLVSLNNEPLDAGSDTEEEAAEFLRRELNLSWQWQLKADNTILDGQWWQPADEGRGLVSVEESVAERLDLELGDTLGFDLAGEPFSAEVASIRSVDWTSMSANFYMLFPPGFLNDYPATYVTSLHVAPAQEESLNGLVQAFPNLSLLDIGVILQQIQNIADRVSRVVEFVFVFTLLAGVLVLFAAVQGSRAQRRNEAAIMRALGARSSLLRTALLTEFLLLGGLAALLATAVAQTLAIIIATQLLDLDYAIRPALWLAAILVSTLAIAGVGLQSVRDVLRQPAMASLR